jgi:hypothetical protein
MSLCKRCSDEIQNSVDNYIGYEDEEGHQRGSVVSLFSVPETDCDFWAHRMLNTVLVRWNILHPGEDKGIP